MHTYCIIMTNLALVVPCSCYPGYTATIDVCIVDIDIYNLQNALVYTTKDDTCEHVIQRKHL